MTRQLVILATTKPIADEILRVLGEEEWPLEVTVIAADGAASVATANARSSHPGLPLAVVAGEEADAVEALAAGADEALALQTIDARGLKLLFERTDVRARLRATNASAQGNAAHAEKLAALGAVVAGVAHEINNPLAAVLLSVGMLKIEITPLIAAHEELQRRAASNRGLLAEEVARLATASRNGSTPSETRTTLEDMEGQIHTISQIVRDLRLYARADDNEAAQLVDMPSLIDQVLRIVGPQIEVRGHIERDYAPDLPPVALPKSRVVQVLTNIFVNAAQALGEVQRSVHRVRITVRTDGEFIAVSIADTGPGIAPDVLERVFDPFFTTKDIGVGTGLGLAISQQILRRLGGDLIAESVHGEGATFIALLPLANATKVAKPKLATRELVVVHSAKRPVVLVVEDDDRLLRTYPRVLQEHYDVITAADGQEAIELLVSGSSADVVVTDLAMPEVDGEALYGWLEVHRPVLAKKTLFITAGARNPRSAAFLETLAGHVVLEKPVQRDDLLAALERVLGA